jgi:hypothetical protein
MVLALQFANQFLGMCLTQRLSPPSGAQCCNPLDSVHLERNATIVLERRCSRGLTLYSMDAVRNVHVFLEVHQVCAAAAV